MIHYALLVPFCGLSQTVCWRHFSHLATGYMATFVEKTAMTQVTGCTVCGIHSCTHSPENRNPIKQ